MTNLILRAPDNREVKPTNLVIVSSTLNKETSQLPSRTIPNRDRPPGAATPRETNAAAV